MKIGNLRVPYQYERGQHRYKHCWNEDRADFVQQGGGWVGKCPNSITEKVAENLLNQAVSEPEPFSLPGKQNRQNAWPKRLFAVYKGVIYEAVPTCPGKSYHGYPWRGGRGRGRLPTEVVDRLRDMATAEGYLEEFEDWLDQHS